MDKHSSLSGPFVTDDYNVFKEAHISNYSFKVFYFITDAVNK